IDLTLIPCPYLIDFKVILRVALRHGVADWPQLGKVEKAKHRAIYKYFASTINQDLPLTQVPTCNVTPGIADNLHVVKKGWNQFTPFLVHKNSGRGFVVTILGQSFVPPGGEAASVAIGSNRDEAQIVSSIAQ